MQSAHIKCKNDLFKPVHSVKTAAYDQNSNIQWYFHIFKAKKNQSQAKQFKELFSLCSNHFQWNGIVICEVWPCLFSISAWTDTQKAVLFTVFSLLKLFFSCCIVVAVAKENLIKTPAIILLANFHCSQILQHLRLSFDWLSVSFFDYWPIRMSGLLLSLHWINSLLYWITWKLHLS